MATCRRSGVNENISTYDSAGGKDYATIAAWEQATDIDLVTATQSEVLEFYKGTHDDRDVFDGATTNASYRRILRPASGEGHSGVPLFDGTIAAVKNTAVNASVLYAEEDYFIITDMVVSNQINADSDRAGIGLRNYTGQICAGSMVVDCSNAWVGREGRGFLCDMTPDDQVLVNCLSHNNEKDGFLALNGGVGDEVYLYNCTSDGNADAGYREAGAGTVVLKNCIYTNNNQGTVGTVSETTCVSTATFANSGSDDFRLAPADSTARNQGTDLSADGIFAFDDDVNNGVMGTAKAGQERGTSGKTWDIGMDEYMINHTANTVGTPYKYNGVHAEDIVEISGVSN